MIYHVAHPDHNEVETVNAGSPQEAARIAVARGNQEAIWTDVVLEVYSTGSVNPVAAITVPSKDTE